MRTAVACPRARRSSSRSRGRSGSGRRHWRREDSCRRMTSMWTSMPSTAVVPTRARERAGQRGMRCCSSCVAAEARRGRTSTSTCANVSGERNYARNMRWTPRFHRTGARDPTVCASPQAEDDTASMEEDGAPPSQHKPADGDGDTLSHRTFIAPWPATTAVVGMAAWAASFLSVALVSVLLLNPSIRGGTAAPPGNGGGTAPAGLALTPDFVLEEQLLQVVAGIGVVALTVQGYRDEIQRRGLFRVDPTVNGRTGEKGANPLSLQGGWLSYGIGFYTAGFAGVTLLGYVLTRIGWYEEQSGRGTADEIASMINPASAAAPTETLLALLLVTAVGAPVLEEVVFRGFLLPSLNRYMNDHLAIAIVSLAFAASHQSVKDFPPVFALGMLLGYSYRSTKHLLTPITVHALWNGLVVVVLFTLMKMGYNVEDIVQRGGIDFGGPP